MKEILLTIIITIGFIHAEEWIYFNHMNDFEYNYGASDADYSASRISPDGSVSEMILEDIPYSDISDDGTKLLYIEYVNWDMVEPVSFSIYNTETSETISSITGISPADVRFTHDENIVLYMDGSQYSNGQLYKYSFEDSSSTMLSDSLSAVFDNMTLSPNGQHVLYFKESQDQPGDVSGCDLPENTLYLTDFDGSPENYTGEVIYNSSTDIGGFQFQANTPPTGCGAGGGDAEDAGFTIEYPSINTISGSSTGSPIPAGCGTLTNLTCNNYGVGLNNIVMFDSEGEILDFNYYDGYIDTDDSFMNVDVIIEDIQTGESTTLATIPYYSSAGGSELWRNSPIWSDNGFIYLTFLDDNNCAQLIGIHSSLGYITQLTDNPCTGEIGYYCVPSILNTKETDLDKFIYSVCSDLGMGTYNWIYDIESGESSFLDSLYSEIGVVSFSIDQSWSPDGTKVSFSEILYNGWVAVPPKIRVYDTVTESFQILSNGNDLYDPESYYIASPINWIEDGLAGDVNGDDSVDVLDVVMLVSYILSGDTSELDGADINNDGDINVLDIVAIVQVILGN